MAHPQRGVSLRAWLAIGCLCACSGGTDDTEAATERPRDHEHDETVDPSYDHCVDGELPDPRDAELSGEPDEWRASTGEVDLVLPAQVLDWMDERRWKESHSAWHDIRRCLSNFSGIPADMIDTAICVNTELIPQDQECENASDGYQFLVMHRHMIRELERAFPDHPQLFEGFPSFPFEAADVPEPWRDRWDKGWAPPIAAMAEQLENIEEYLDRFPTEGDLGQFIQCNGGLGGVHGAMHFKWVVNESPNSLGKQQVNLGNYMFWKLHGWIDMIWERYRVARGIESDDRALQRELVKQCREMHALAEVAPMRRPVDTEPLPEESGFFHERVRPILEKHCSGCHSESSPEAKMALGGHVSSSDIVRGLVNVRAMHGGQFMRVEPGQPDRSWLYLRISNLAVDAGCEGEACRAGVMPPAGEVTVSASEREVIREWIENGAEAPSGPTSEPE